MMFEFRIQPKGFDPMTNSNDVYVELTDEVDRIGVYFKYSAEDVAAVKRIKGRRFHDEGQRKYWTVPMDINKARQLREEFGDRMQLGPAVRVWAKEVVKQERNMRQLNAATDAKLTSAVPLILRDAIAGRPIVHESIPIGHALRRKRPPRPYQRADIRLMSLASACNFNDVGTGKTLEAIGAIYEAGIDTLPHLIVAPRRALENVWQTEFDRFSDIVVLTSESPSVRKQMMEEIVTLAADGQHIALALIADDLRVEKYYDIKNPKQRDKDPLHACNDYKGNWYRFRTETQRDLFDIDWGAFIIDECHQTGLPNRNSLFSISANLIKAERRWPMSGTPIGGKPRRLWPILHFIDKKQYSAEWAWITDWLEVTEDKIYVKGGGGAQRSVKTVGGIAPDREEAFWEHHRMHMVRRTKKDALPGIPDAVEILVETPMDGKQRADYHEFDDNHEIVLDGKRLSGSIVLAQYTRLRQMANSCLKDHDDRWIATDPSNKLDYLIERLDENGIRRSDYEPGARAYVGVLDKSYLTVVHRALALAGIECDRLDGDTKDSKPLLKRFADGKPKPYVIIMTVQTGGTALNLETANSAHLLDEPWDPDVAHQFFGRGDRGARDTALKCYTYRTPHSIQEYVAKVAGDKKLNNRTVLNYVEQIEALRRGAK